MLRRATLMILASLWLSGCGSDSGGNDGDNNDGALILTGCIDGDYTETLPDPTLDLSAEIAAFDSDDLAGFLTSVLDKRYPLGSLLVTEGQKAEFGNCVEFFDRGTASAAVAFDKASLFVHECGHFYDLEISEFGGSTYVVTENLRFDCMGGNTQGFGEQTIARSLINDDPFAAARPHCSGAGRNCDSYGPVYLDGDPTDDEFDGGDQGYDSVLEEALQYINSLATDYAFADQLGGQRSSRDGILTFLWYITRYLRLAREQHPEVYEFITNDRCYREATLTIWGRAWLYLQQTQNMFSLQIDEAGLIPLATAPELVQEIARLREVQGCQ